jgi:hypothetical protein
MGWTNMHLYEIRARRIGWGIPDSDWGDGPLDARKARLDEVAEDVGTKTLRYLYDFGDGWEHTIRIERLIDPELGRLYPRLIESKDDARPKMSGAHGDMPNSSKSSTIPIMSVMPNSANGSQKTSIQTSLISKGSPENLPRLQNDGCERSPANEHVGLNPQFLTRT